MGAPLQEGVGMAKHKVTRCELRRAQREARKLLESSRFFNKFLLAMRKAGLVGEELNAVVVLIVVISRILHRPLNLFVKGHSSAGKNWLVTRVFRLVPKSAVVEITSASDQAWNYSRSDFRNRAVYVPERNEAAGRMETLRLLISEGQVVRIVTKWIEGKLLTKKYVTRGPVAAISTSTKNRLEIDDETRHVSIWVDESSDQTRDIVRSYTEHKEHLSRKELRVWRTVHRLLEGLVGTKITFPKWFKEIADRLFVDDLRVRRYYPAFVEACRTVCLIRSFLPHRKRGKRGELEVDFADFAITTVIFDPVFVESLHLGKAAGETTRRLVDEIAVEKERPVRAKDVAHKLGISMDQAYSKLRYAERMGVIRRVNKPEKGNRKTYLATPRPRFVPDPEKLFQKIKNLGPEVKFVHPITGDWVIYRRKK
jgi:hypothetical protein